MKSTSKALQNGSFESRDLKLKKIKKFTVYASKAPEKLSNIAPPFYGAVFKLLSVKGVLDPAIRVGSLVVVHNSVTT